MAPAVPSAEASHNKRLKTHTPTRLLEKQSQRKLLAHYPLMSAYATLRYRKRMQPGGVNAGPSNSGGKPFDDDSQKEIRQVNDPIVVFRGKPEEMNKHGDIFNGDYAWGSVDLSSGVPVVKLHILSETTTVTPKDENGIYLRNATLEREPGTYNTRLDWNRDQTEYDPVFNAPFIDPAGNPERVAFEYTPKK